MNYYNIWFNLIDPHKDIAVSENIDKYMSYLKENQMIEGWNLTRRKLGFGPPDIPEFHLSVHVKNLTQLDEAFLKAATRGPDVEPLHREVYKLVRDAKFALYRDFPDNVRIK